MDFKVDYDIFFDKFVEFIRLSFNYDIEIIVRKNFVY